MPVHLFRPVLRELTTNVRLQWGFWLILGILLGHIIVLQFDRLTAARHDYHATTKRLQKVETMLRQRDSAVLLETEHQIHRKIRSMYWQAKTEGLALAKVESALSRILNHVGSTNLHFRSGSVQPVSGLPRVSRIQTRLDANLRPGSELRLVRALATHPNILIVDRLDLRRHSQNRTYLVLIVTCYFFGLQAERTK